jgi:hypothetical protein
MRSAWSILCTVLAAVLLVSGCAYFRPSQTEAERLQEQQSVRQDQYLKGTVLDGAVQALGSLANHN